MSRIFLRLVLIPIISLASSACGDSGPSSPTPTPPPFSQVDLMVGTGAEATNGRRVTVHYTGWLYDPAAPDQKGRAFDSSVGRTPLSFTLGAGQVIRGWDQGVVGMRVGGQRRLIIPPSLAYGSTGNGPIPPNASLVFDIELLNVQ